MSVQPFADQFTAAIDQAAPLRRNRADHAFGLHPALYVATIACYFAFLAIMGLTFMNPELILPFAIFSIYIVMAFGTPGLWARLQAPDPRPRPSWSQWLSEGIDTGSGRLSGGAAVAQVMTLPVLIVCWGVAIAVIRASV